MNKITSILLLFFLISNALSAQLPAFPGAEGFGKYSQGARAATNPSVYHVTNLNDSGTGSFRDAISQPDRIIVFDVAGVIKISSRLIFSSNLTIAGQTAPGDGISVYGNGVTFSGTKNLIIRNMRFRMGVKGESGRDAAGIANGTEMIFDHCSFNWGLDETFSINWDGKGSEPGNITIQNSIIGMGIMAHSAGGLMQTNGGVTLYKNLYTDNKTRNPKVKGLNQYVNNVVYNWGSGGGYILGDTEASSWGTIENNYFIKGPATGGTPAFSRANNWFQVLHSGNMLDYDRDGVLNGISAVESDFGPVTFVSNAGSFSGIPKTHPDINKKLAAIEAYYWILDSVGAVLPFRDQVDAYIIEELKSLGTKGTLINGEADLGLVNGVGYVFGAKKQPDTDNDGIPDVWEDANGLNKNNPADALQLHTSGYFNIEMYISSISKGQDFIKTPTAFSIKQVNDNFVILKWTNHALNATELVVEQSSDNLNFTEIARLNKDISEYKVADLAKSTSYYFRIKAVNAQLESLYAASVKGVTTGADAPPVACTDPVPANESLISAFTQATLNWSNPSAAGGIVYYNLYVGTSPDNLVQKTAGSTLSSYNMAILPNVTYYWKVDAMNLLGIQPGDVWSFTTGFRPPREKVAYFSMDESSGNAASNEINGSAVATGFSPQWTSGKINNAIFLPGTPTNAAMVQTHYDNISLGAESFSVEMWFKSAGGAVDWYLIHKGSHAKNATTGSTGKWFGIQYNKIGSNDRLTWAIDDDVTKTDINVTGASAYFNNQWHHLVAIRDVEMDQIRIFMDGVLKGSKTDATSNIAQTENLVIGNVNNPNAIPTNAFNGFVDDVSVYKGVLTDAEINENYQKGLQTGIKNTFENSELTIFPNPFKNQIIVSGMELNENNRVEIIAMSGQIVFQTSIISSGSKHVVNGLEILAPGIYTLRISSGNTIKNLKIKK